MDKDRSAITRMKELVDILGAAGRAYYQDDSSVMTDYQYDALAQELAALEAQTGVVLAASPSVNVGYSVQSALEKVPHDQPLLSLDKTKDVGRLAAFMGAHKCLLSWKLDGLTVVANYVGGEPVMALTRGNGLVGENITHNALVFRNIPRRISNTAPLSIRGEAVITFADFERVNRGQDDADKYKNPRNLTSGSVRQLNSEIAARRGIMFYAFALTGGGLETDSKEEQLKLLETLGFDVTPYAVVSADTVEDAVEEFRQAAGGLPYATDGLVATYDSIAFSRSLGQTSKFPHDSIAFKWADEAAQTTLTEVSWGTSRTGLINPVAVFEPVELEGSTVRQASLHNISIIEALELGLGDTITVYKANMIIPQVGDNLTRSGGLPIPASCPVCETAAQIRDEHGIKTLFCPNLDCRSRLVRALAHYVSRDAANIEGLSEASIEKFVEAGFLQSYADIYRLKDFEAQITAMDGFGKKSFDKLAASVEKSRTMELASFINALGIPQIGAENAKQLAANLGTPQAIVSATAEELVSIPGFGEKIALSVTAYFADPLNLELLHQTLPLLNLTEPVQPPADGKYSGLNFVITGSINNYANRKQLQAHIEAHGGRVASAVSKATTHLINNDSASASAKNKKARELGVSVITEAEFELL